jgi:HlyD family secretion protein
MTRMHILLSVAVLGIAVAVVAVVRSCQPAPSTPLVVQPPRVPFPNAVAGVGVIESSTGNIAIGTPVSGIIAAMYVQAGDHVKAGDPLFKIDDRDLQARRLTATAKVREAEAVLEKARHRLEYTANLERRLKRAVSAQQLTALRDEVAVAETELGSARAEAAQIDEEIGRLTVRAPAAGEVLQVHGRLGEYAQGDAPGSPLMVLGGDKRLHVRVDIDENEAWRIRPEAKAKAFLRSNPDINMPLRYEYMEPYVVPKTELTGRSTERTDTRVLQVIYSFDKGALPVYVGQQVDVFVEAAPVPPPEPQGGR